MPSTPFPLLSVEDLFAAIGAAPPLFKLSWLPAVDSLSSSMMVHSCALSWIPPTAAVSKSSAATAATCSSSSSATSSSSKMGSCTSVGPLSPVESNDLCGLCCGGGGDSDRLVGVGGSASSFLSSTGFGEADFCCCCCCGCCSWEAIQ